MKKEKNKILMAKIGLDYHNRGLKVVARLLRDQGYEVIYSGLRQTPEMVAIAALQEDANLIGISILSGAHLPLVSKLIHLLNEQGTSIPVVVGGIIPERDVPKLKEMGVKEIFGPGSKLEMIGDWIGKYLGDQY